MPEDPTYWPRGANLVAETLDDETLIIDWESGVFYRLTGVSSALWARLAAGALATELAAELDARYGADASRDVAAFFAVLAAEGLVTTDGPPPNAANPPALGEIAWPTMFDALELRKYADMADLLLVDPIHDVDVEGWPERRDA